eukprot:Pgem_evm1s19519
MKSFYTLTFSSVGFLASVNANVLLNNEFLTAVNQYSSIERLVIYTFGDSHTDSGLLSYSGMMRGYLTNAIEEGNNTLTKQEVVDSLRVEQPYLDLGFGSGKGTWSQQLEDVLWSEVRNYAYAGAMAVKDNGEPNSTNVALSVLHQVERAIEEHNMTHSQHEKDSISIIFSPHNDFYLNFAPHIFESIGQLKNATFFTIKQIIQNIPATFSKEIDHYAQDISDSLTKLQETNSTTPVLMSIYPIDLAPIVDTFDLMLPITSKIPGVKRLFKWGIRNIFKRFNQKLRSTCSKLNITFIDDDQFLRTTFTELQKQGAILKSCAPGMSAYTCFPWTGCNTCVSSDLALDSNDVKGKYVFVSI